jgi:hypothetical protein
MHTRTITTTASAIVPREPMPSVKRSVVTNSPKPMSVRIANRVRRPTG